MTRPTLSPEMLLFEVAAICSRHGIPVSTHNPAAALTHAARLLQALGLAEAPPAIEAATSVLPVVVDEPPATGDPHPGWNLALPSAGVRVHVPRGLDSGMGNRAPHALDRSELPPRRPIDGHTFTRGRQRPGDPPALRSVQ